MSCFRCYMITVLFLNANIVLLLPTLLLQHICLYWNPTIRYRESIRISGAFLELSLWKRLFLQSCSLYWRISEQFISEQIWKFMMANIWRACQIYRHVTNTPVVVFYMALNSKFFICKKITGKNFSKKRYFIPINKFYKVKNWLIGSAAARARPKLWASPDRDG